MRREDEPHRRARGTSSASRTRGAPTSGREGVAEKDKREGARSPELTTEEVHAWAGKGRALVNPPSHDGQLRNLPERRDERAQSEGRQSHAAHIAPPDAADANVGEREGGLQAGGV